jgi:hypothetical protein
VPFDDLERRRPRQFPDDTNVLRHLFRAKIGLLGKETPEVGRPDRVGLKYSSRLVNGVGADNPVRTP